MPYMPGLSPPGLSHLREVSSVSVGSLRESFVLLCNPRAWSLSPSQLIARSRLASSGYTMRAARGKLFAWLWCVMNLYPELDHPYCETNTRSRILRNGSIPLATATQKRVLGSWESPSLTESPHVSHRVYYYVGSEVSNTSAKFQAESDVLKTHKQNCTSAPILILRPR